MRHGMSAIRFLRFPISLVASQLITNKPRLDTVNVNLLADKRGMPGSVAIVQSIKRLSLIHDSSP